MFIILFLFLRAFVKFFFMEMIFLESSVHCLYKMIGSISGSQIDFAMKKKNKKICFYFLKHFFCIALVMEYDQENITFLIASSRTLQYIKLAAVNYALCH